MLERAERAEAELERWKRLPRIQALGESLRDARLEIEFAEERAERAEAEAREWKRDFESALARNAEDGWYRLTEEDRQVLLTALDDVWPIQPFYEPNPHAATLLFRKLSTAETERQ